MADKRVFGLAWKQDGRVMAYPFPAGDGSGTPKPDPFPPDPGISLACGKMTAFVRKDDGTISSMGQNDYGQLGRNVSTGTWNAPNVGTIPGLDGVVQMSCAFGATHFLLENGTVRNAGYNGYGSLGRNVESGSSAATNFGMIPTVSKAKKIGSADNVFHVLRHDGTIWNAGQNSYGQLGRNVASGSESATNFGMIPDMYDAVDFVCSRYTLYVLKADGSVWSAGLNADGQLCRAVASGSASATNFGPIPDLAGVKKMICGENVVHFLLSDGTVRNAGSLADGRLCRAAEAGTAEQTNLGTIPGVTDAEDVAGRGETLFIRRAGGTVWNGGANSLGQLCRVVESGDPAALNFGPIPDLTDVTEMTVSDWTAFFKLADGTIWNGGNNEYGQIGRISEGASAAETNFGLLTI